MIIAYQHNRVFCYSLYAACLAKLRKVSVTVNDIRVLRSAILLSVCISSSKYLENTPQLVSSSKAEPSQTSKALIHVLGFALEVHGAEFEEQ